MRYTHSEGVIPFWTKTSLLAVAVMFAVTLVMSVMTTANAATLPTITFEDPPYTAGNINGQDGWSKTGPYDHEVAAQALYNTEFSDQSLRISNGVASGSFGDQTISPSLPVAAGESTADPGTFSASPSSDYFEASFDFASTTQAPQSNITVNVSPDRGDGARMSYVGVTDNGTNMDVIFYDYQVGTGGPMACDGSFALTTVASGLDRTKVHNVKLQMWFEDGSSNDVVTVTVNDTEIHTGTSWEDYFTGCENQQTRTVDSLIFLTRGTSQPANMGNGFYFDNISMTTDEPPYPVSGSIIAPTDGEVVSGMVNLHATYDDGDSLDDDSNNWAVRPDSSGCNSGGNLFGGGPLVSGVVNSTESESWDGSDFTATIDSTKAPDGNYCFVFNPTDDPGQADVREVVHFSINNTPDTKEDCKLGGWTLFFNPVFRNQGDCVSWISSAKQQADNPDANRGRR